MGDWSDIRLPARPGPPPLATTTGGPVEQITQMAGERFQDTLLSMIEALPGVTVRPSTVCVPGSRGCHLAAALASGLAGASHEGSEFAHVHPHYDGSLHLVLPPELARRAVAAGWGLSLSEADHGNSLLVFGPRDESELVVIWMLFLAAYQLAAPVAGLSAREEND